MLVRDISIKAFFVIFVFSLVGCSVAKGQNLKHEKYDVSSALDTMNRSMANFFYERDSLFQKENTYAFAKIVSSRDRFLDRQWLYKLYQKDVDEIEIFDVTDVKQYSSGVTSFIFFNTRLVIYYSDASSGTYAMICDICKMDKSLLNPKKYFILHSKIDKDDKITIEVLE